MEAKEFYKNAETPPDWAMKSIGAGRLAGMTDINPQWRIKMLVDNFGFCGIGWKYSVKKLWFEDCQTERLAFAEIELFIKHEDIWSDPIPGIGGSKMMAQEKSGVHNSDECYKMAITDAISVACKMLGIGASIYSGSKYVPVLEQEGKAAKTDVKNEKFQLACDEMERSSDLECVKQAWTNWKEFQTNAEFIAIKEKMKSKLNTKS